MPDYPLLYLDNSDPPVSWMRGPFVSRFQEAAENVIANAAFLSNDGVFGPRTELLAKELQKKLGITVDGIVGSQTWAAMWAYLEKGSNEEIQNGPRITQIDGVTVVDGRHCWKPPSSYYNKLRTWNTIEGVMLHQTGCWMPESADRWASINAHIGITRHGQIILMHSFDKIIWHGHSPSKTTIGIEIAGNFMGVEGISWSYWKPGGGPHEFTEEQLKATTVLFKILKDEFAENGGVWSRIYAHRQSAESRINDPGEAIWKKVGMVWLKELGAGVSDGGPKFKVGEGHPIPREWNPEYQHKYP